MQGTERLKSCDSLKLESLQSFLSQVRSQLLIGCGVHLCGTWSQSSSWLSTLSIASTWNAPSFPPLLSLHHVHSFWWLFKLLDLKQSLKCMVGWICVAWHWENDYELCFLFHMLTFYNIFVKHCFHLKGTLIFKERLDLCSVLQFLHLGKQSCKFIIVALSLLSKFFADTVIYFNMLCNHF